MFRYGHINIPIRLGYLCIHIDTVVMQLFPVRWGSWLGSMRVSLHRSLSRHTCLSLPLCLPLALSPLTFFLHSRPTAFAARDPLADRTAPHQPSRWPM